MIRSVVIADNYSELLLILNTYQNLDNIYVVLLSRNFTIAEVDFIFESYEASWFDEFIDCKNAKQVVSKKNKFLWNWFLDKDGKDLSEINGCSLGSAFAPSISMILDSVLKYKRAMVNFLRRDDSVYYCSSTEDIFLDVIEFLHKEIEFKAILINNNISNNNPIYRNINIDYDGRKRNLTRVFNQSKFIKSVLANFLDIFKKKLHNNTNRVLFMNSGKMEEFIKHANDSSVNQWVVPISSMRDVFTNLVKRESLYYQFYPLSLSRYNVQKVSDIANILKENLGKNKYIKSDLLIRIMNRHIFNVFNEAYGYYLCVLRQMHSLQPKAVVYSAETSELHILAAQAGKQYGAINIIMPHGLMQRGYSETKNGKFGVFEYALAFGRLDFLAYRYLGIKQDNIRVSSFPYFEKFLPIKKSIGNRRYRKAVILPPDPSNDFCEKNHRSFDFYQNILNLLDKLEIDLSSIKLRHGMFTKVSLSSNKNQVDINGRVVSILSGYGALKETIKDSDLVIGPAGTALIETLLMGKDYFIYHEGDVNSEIDPTYFPILDEYMYISYNISQLEENIKNKRIYKKDCSVNDLVDLLGVDNKEDLLKKFDVAIVDIIETNRKNGNC